MPSNSINTKVGLVFETTPGTTPATPAFRNQRITGATLDFNEKTDVSKELRPDRMVPDVILLGTDPTGTLPFEVSHLGQNDFIEASMFNRLSTRWGLAVGAALTGLVNAGAGAMTLTITALTGGTAPAAGNLYRFSGFANPGNNGIFVLTGGSATTLLFTNTLGVSETPPAGARIKFVGAQGAATALAATDAGGVTTLTGLPTAIAGLVAGEWIKVGGIAGTAFAFATAGEGWARLSIAQAGTTATFDQVPSTWAVDAGTGQTIQVFVGEYARPGLTRTGFTVTIEEQFQDLAVPEFHYYDGMTLSKLTFTAKQQAMLTGSAEFMGQTTTIATSRFSGATDIAPPTFDIMTTATSAGRVFINGLVPADLNYVQSVDVTIDNTLRSQVALGSTGPIGIGIGRSMVTGKMGFFYTSQAVLNNLRSNLPVSLMVLSAAGDDTYGREGLLIDMPRIKFTKGGVEVPAIDTDRMWNPAFTATLDPIKGYNVHLQVFEGWLGA